MRRTALFGAALGVLFASRASAQPISEPDPVYYVVYQTVRDQARFSAYVEAVSPAIARRGGELVAAGAPAFTEGAAPYGRLVVFRYPSRPALELFLRSDEYADIRALRAGAADWLSAIVPALPASRP